MEIVLREAGDIQIRFGEYPRNISGNLCQKKENQENMNRDRVIAVHKSGIHPQDRFQQRQG